MDGFAWFIIFGGLVVGTAVGLGVRLIQLVVEFFRHRQFARSVGWGAVLIWTLGFAATAFVAASAMSIGIGVLPLAVIVCCVATWRFRALPEGLIGAGLGTGIILGIIGLINPTSPSPCIRSGYVRPGEGGRFSCGGVDGTSWLPLAAILVVVALAAQQVIAQRESRRARLLRREALNDSPTMA